MAVPIKDHPHLTKIGQYFYFRRKVPLHLVEAMGKKMMKRSLRTQDRREANRLINDVAAEIQRQFNEAEKPSEKTPSAISHGRSLASVKLNEIEQSARDWYYDKLCELPGPIELAAIADRAEALLEAEIDLSDILERPGDDLGIIAAKIFEGMGVRVEWKEPRTRVGNIELCAPKSPRPVWKEDSGKSRALTNLLYRAAIELARQKIARLRRDFTDRCHDDFFKPNNEPSRNSAQYREDDNFRETAEVKSNQSLTILLEEWTAFISESMKPRQVVQYVSDLKALASEIPHMSDLKTSSLQQFLEKNLKGLAPNTVVRKFSVYRNYWQYLGAKGFVSKSFDPFEGVLLPTKSVKTKRAAWSSMEVCKLWREARYRKLYTLADVIRIGAFTGSRIEAICSISLADIVDTEEAFYVRFSDKTEAGQRDVPIHSALQPLFRRLMAEATGRNGFLIPSTMKNRHGERSTALGKQFGKMKTDLKFDERYVFHSIRKTVINLLSRSGCLEAVAADIVGHEVKTMTYGLYRTEASLDEKKRWLETALTYPDEAFMTENPQ